MTKEVNMSNSEMIGTAFQMNGLVYTKKEYNTFAGWKRRGRNIKKGWDVSRRNKKIQR